MNIKTIKMGTSLLLMVLLTSCTTGNFRSDKKAVQSEIITVDDLKDTVWLNPVCGMPRDGVPGFEGFFLASDGTLQFINIISMTGETWSLEGNQLILLSHTERYSEPHETRYSLRKEGGGIEIEYPELNETGKTGLQLRDIQPGPPEGIWTVSILPNPDNFLLPREREVFFEYVYNPDDSRIHGFGGVNGFGGSLKTDGYSWTGGPFMRTLMAGPSLDYENLFMQSLEKADRYLLIEDFLFLYKGSEPLLIMKR